MVDSKSSPNPDPSNLHRAWIFITLLAIQIGIQPILNREFVHTDAKHASIVFLTELTKFFLAFFMIFLENHSECFKGWKVLESLQGAAVPAAIYTVQNLLLQQAYQNLDFITFNLLNQTKLLSTALFIYFLVGHQQSYTQCLALFILMMGSALISKDTSDSHEVHADSNRFWHGVIPILLASLLSGIASALSQVALQGRRRNSYLYSMELAAYGMICLGTVTAAGVSNAESHDGAIGRPNGKMDAGLLHGWTLLTVLPVVVSAMGGIFVGQVTKYAGGVHKGFSVMLGILLTAVLQRAVYGHPIPAGTWLAAPLIVGSIALHSLAPPRPRPAPTPHPKLA